MIQTEIQPDADVIASRIAALGDCRLSAITPAPPPERVADCPFVRTGHRTIISGRGGTGKSTLQYQIGAACSAGNHWQGCAGDLDYTDLPGGVLILTDEPPARVAARMARFEPPALTFSGFEVAHEIDPDRIHVVPINDIDIGMLHEAIDAWSIALLIIDPLRRLLMRGVDREDFDSVWSACESADRRATVVAWRGLTFIRDEISDSTKAHIHVTALGLFGGVVLHRKAAYDLTAFQIVA